MTMDLEQAGLRLDIEDRPADADVEVLPNWLEAFNECCWPGHRSGYRSPSSRATESRSSPASRERLTAAGSSSNISGLLTHREDGALGARSSAQPRAA